MGVFNGDERHDVAAHLPGAANRTVRDCRPRLSHGHPSKEAPRQKHVDEVEVVISSPEPQSLRQRIRLHECVDPRGDRGALPRTKVRHGPVLTREDDEPVGMQVFERELHHAQRGLDDRPVAPVDVVPLDEVDAARRLASPRHAVGSEVMVNNDLSVRAQFEDPGGEGLHLRGVPVAQDQIRERRPGILRNQFIVGRSGHRLYTLLSWSRTGICGPSSTVFSILAETQGSRFGSSFRAKAAPDATTPRGSSSLRSIQPGVGGEAIRP